MSSIKSILVIGSQGQLGQTIKMLAGKYPSYDFTFVGRNELNLGDKQSITDFFKQKQYDVIINCAAYTNVDKAESEPELTDKVNHLAVNQLAEIAQKQQSKLIHISTDYVFSGQQSIPYIESDDIAPQGVYARTKLKGEQAILEIMANNAIIIRTSWLYSDFGHNFVKSMLKLAQERDSLNVVFDQIGTPTYAYDLALAVMAIVQNDVFKAAKFTSEIYHYSNEGVCSWYDFAQAIIERSGMECDVYPIESKDYPTAAMRPNYSLLNKNKIKKKFQLDIPYWRDSLQHCLMNLQQTSNKK